MKITDLVQKFITSKETPVETPEGTCPNCWGRQEYAGKFYDAVKTEHITVDNITEKKGWIQAYATENFKGIQLESQKTGNTCPSCQVDYQ